MCAGDTHSEEVEQEEEQEEQLSIIDLRPITIRIIPLSSAFSFHVSGRASPIILSAANSDTTSPPKGRRASLVS